jgi:hypothetical protein
MILLSLVYIHAVINILLQIGRQVMSGLFRGPWPKPARASPPIWADGNDDQKLNELKRDAFRCGMLYISSLLVLMVSV